MTTINPESFKTLVDLLHWRGQHQPDDIAITYLVDGEDEEEHYTYAEFDQRNRAIAAWLLQRATPGDRILLLYPASLGYISAFFGCLYAGMVAVPAYPPRLNQPDRRLYTLIADAGAKLVFTDRSIYGKVEKRFEQMPELAALEWQVTEDIPLEYANQWQAPTIAPSDVAFLQYTSGSTSDPKGVIVTHGNLMSNERQVKLGYEHDKPVFITWLPMYHDMGLIGNIMQPLYCGGRTVVMSPTAFLQRPYRWLKAITKYGGETSGAPNFAYDLCVAKITPEEKATLDLSTWTIAYNGAEPVRAETLYHFANTFSEVGFNPTALFPCYGLAEATLFVTGGPKQEMFVYDAFDALGLERNDVIPVAQDAENARMLVGSGVVWGQTVQIVDPDTLEAVDGTRVGEIWIKGPNVAGGYWNKPEKTREDFGAYLAGTDDGPYLRTGDLGFIRDGQLFVTGRIKDLIIIHGRNHYPQDIELTVERAHPALRPGCTAAFSVDVQGEEQLVVVQEVKRQYRQNFNADEIFTAIREEVAKNHQLMLHGIAIIDTLTILKTSSGKIQRRANKRAYLEGEHEVLAAWVAPLPEVNEAATPPLTDTSVGTRPASSVAVTDAPLRDFNGYDNALYPLALGAQNDPTADSLMAWLRDYLNTRVNSRIMDERRTIAPHIVLDMGNRGLLGMQVPHDMGGLGLGAYDTMRFIQQLGAADVTLSLFVGLSNILGVRPVMNFAHSPLREQLLPLLASGREVASFALTEPGAGSNPRALAGTATPAGHGRWLLNAHKIWSGVAQWAGSINVFVKQLDDKGHPIGMIAFNVRQGSPGLTQGPEAMTFGMRSMIQNAMFFQDVPVTAEQMLGEPGQGMDVAQDAMMYGRLAIAASSVGAMKRAAQIILRYADRRTVSTGNLLKNPVTLATLSHITAAADAADSAVAQIGLALDAGATVPVEAFTAVKIAAPELAYSAVDQAIQLLGGRGYIETSGLPQMSRDVRIFRIFEGPTETLRVYLGSRIMNQPDDLSQFIGGVLGATEVAQQMVNAAAHIRDRITANKRLFNDDATRLQWAYNLAGEVATYAVILAAAQNAFAQTRQNRYRRAMEWAETVFEIAINQAISGAPAENTLLDSDALRDVIAGFTDSIGDLEQTLSNEDYTVDGYLRRTFDQNAPTVARPSTDATGGAPTAISVGTRPASSVSAPALKVNVPPAPAAVGTRPAPSAPSASIAPRLTENVTLSDVTNGHTVGTPPVASVPVTPVGNGQPAANKFAPATLRRWISEWMVGNLQVPRGVVDPKKPFAEYGMDSVKAVEFAQDLEELLEDKVEIDEVVAWNYPNVDALIQYITESLAEAAQNAPVASAPAAATPVDAGEEDEIARLLAQELDASRKRKQ